MRECRFEAFAANNEAQTMPQTMPQTIPQTMPQTTSLRLGPRRGLPGCSLALASLAGLIPGLLGCFLPALPRCSLGSLASPSLSWLLPGLPGGFLTPLAAPWPFWLLPGRLAAFWLPSLRPDPPQADQPLTRRTRRLWRLITWLIPSCSLAAPRPLPGIPACFLAAWLFLDFRATNPVPA